jgi:hypothetical protein
MAKMDREQSLDSQQEPQQPDQEQAYGSPTRLHFPAAAFVRTGHRRAPPALNGPLGPARVGDGGIELVADPARSGATHYRGA